MARCDEGYDCDSCGEPVDAITDSGLYLRYVLGEVPLEQLHLHPERHVHCDPTLAQYIVDDAFPAVSCDGPFAKAGLDGEFVSSEEARVTTGWRRLQAIPALGLALPEYPLSITPSEDLP